MFENDDPAKRAAGYSAVDRFVRDGTCVGLGTGTTAYWAIERVGERIAAGERICRGCDVARNRSALPEIERAARRFVGAPDAGRNRRRRRSRAGLVVDQRRRRRALSRESRCALRRAIRRRRYRIEARAGVGSTFRCRSRSFPTPHHTCGAKSRSRFADIEIARRGAGEDPFVTDNGNWIFRLPLRPNRRSPTSRREASRDSRCRCNRTLLRRRIGSSRRRHRWGCSPLAACSSPRAEPAGVRRSLPPSSRPVFGSTTIACAEPHCGTNFNE